MTNLTESAIDRARQDVLALRQSLADLAYILGQQADAVSGPDEAAPPLDDEKAAHRLQRIKALLQQVSGFLDRLRADLDLQEKEQAQLQGLCKVSRAVNSTLDLNALLNLVMDTIIEVMGAERGFLLLFDPSGKELAAAVARNMDGQAIQGSELEVSRSIIAKVAKEGLPILTTNAQTDPRFAGRESIVSYQLRSIICVPLRVKERVTGVIYVDNRLQEGVFSPDDRDLMASFADQAAIGIENARLFTDLQQKMSEIATMKSYMDHIFASIASGVITLDMKGIVTTINPAAAGILGITPQQALGRPYQQTLSLLQEPSLAQMLERVRREGQRFVGQEIELAPNDGQKAWLSLSLSPLKDGRGQTLGIAIALEDLTERKRLEQERQAEEREKQRIRQLFQRYVAPQVVERILSDPSQVALGGRRQEVSILFADVRGFSAFAEGTTPEVLFTLLNQHLAVAAEAILAEEGTLDKYEGDSVMAIFNAPLPQPDHPLRAVRAALAMQEALAAYHRQLPAGSSRFQYGIGINVGEAIAGNVGVPQMMNYTVIGDAVNLAKRLQENAAPGQILLSEAAYLRVREHVIARPLPPLAVKGHSRSEQVYELLGWTGNSTAEQDAPEAAPAASAGDQLELKVHRA